MAALTRSGDPQAGLEALAQTVGCIAEGMALVWADLTGWPDDPRPLLHQTLAALRTCSAPGHAIDAQLDRMWRRLALDEPARLRPEVVAAVRALWADAAQREAYGHALERLAGLLAAAGAASAARAADELGTEALALWARRVAEPFGEEPGALDTLPPGVEARLDAALPAASAPRARLYARWCLLGGLAEPDTPPVRVKVLHRAGASAQLLDLRLRPQPGLRGAVPHPEAALRLVDDAFREALEGALRQTVSDPAAGVVWWVEPCAPAAAELVLRGRDIGIPAQVGCHALAEGWRPDPDWVLLSEGDGLAADLDIARKHGLRGAVVLGGAGEVRATPGLEIIEAPGGPPDACARLRAASAPLADYLRALADLDRLCADFEGEAPAYLRGRRLSELYADPLVELLTPRQRQSWVLAAQRDDWVQMDQDESKRTVPSVLPWAGVEQRLTQAVLLGRPGEGKTLAALALAARVAGQSLAGLERGQLGSGSAPLPVVLRLADVADHGSLRGAIEAALAPWPGVAGMAAAALNHPRLWLVLDGLEEIDDPPRLQAALAELGGAPRLLVTATEGVSPQALGRQLDQGFRLAPLASDERDAFITRWFGADEAAAAAVRAWIDELPPFDYTRAPLTLTLACSAWTPPPAEPFTRRVDVLRRALDALLDRGDDAEARRLAGALAWRLFADAPQRTAYRDDAWRRALGEVCGAADAALSAADLEQRLVASGLWRRRGERWRPAQRVLHELLAAEHLATRPSGEVRGAVAPLLWRRRPCGLERWEPAAGELLALLAGCLDEPLPLLRQVLAADDPVRDEAGRQMLVLAGRLAADARATPRTERLLHTLSERLLLTLPLVGVDSAAGLRHPTGAWHLNRALYLGAWRYPEMGGVDPMHFFMVAVLAALGHRGRDLTREVLQHLHHPNHEVRATVARGAQENPDPDAARAIVDALRLDRNHLVQYAAADALATRPGLEASLALLGALSDPLGGIRARAAESLSQRPAGEVLDGLVTALREGDLDRRSAALWALARHPDADAAQRLLATLADPDPALQAAAALALTQRREHAAGQALAAAVGPDTGASPRRAEVPALVAALGDADADTRLAAVMELRRRGGDTVREGLLTALGDVDPRLRREAACGLAAHAGDAVAQALRAAANDPHRAVRVSALRSLVHHPSAATAERLQAVARDDDPSVAQAAAETARLLLRDGWRGPFQDPFAYERKPFTLRRRVIFWLLEHTNRPPHIRGKRYA